MSTWIKDDNGNKCSVEFFGSKEAAQAMKKMADAERGL